MGKVITLNRRAGAQNAAHSRVEESARAALCHAIDLAKLVEQDSGRPTRPANGHRVGFAPWHEEQTPSLHIYPPGVGKFGGQGWTWHHYGTGQHGDAVAYLAESRGLPFLEAVHEAERLTGLKVTGQPGDDRPAARLVPPTSLNGTNVPISRPAMTMEEQMDAAHEFARLLLAVVGDGAAFAQAEAYLAGRGVTPAALVEACKGEAWYMPGEAAPEILKAAQASGSADLLTRAGIIRPPEDGKPARLAWWDDCAFLPSMDAQGRGLAYLVARRIDPEAKPKYMNQPTSGGARRVPFGLPSLRMAAEDGAEVLLVEGPITALGGISLGFHCVALLGRPGFSDYKTGEQTSQGEMLAPMLQDLARCRRVLVVPDNDADPDKAKVGQDNAGELVRWLRANGLQARLETMNNLGFGIFKDLADAAKARGQNDRN